MNVDIWNFWHYTFTAAMVYAVSGSIWQALAAVIFQVICLKVADWTAPMMSEFLIYQVYRLLEVQFLMHQVFT